MIRILLVSALMWFGIFWGASNLLAAEPPQCKAAVCEMYGPGGYVRDWKLAVMLANLEGKPIVVPPNKVCASACAIAIGHALHKGYDVRIASSAKFIPHNLEAIKQTPMSGEFKRLMLRYEPFTGSQVQANFQ